MLQQGTKGWRLKYKFTGTGRTSGLRDGRLFLLAVSKYLN